MRMFITVHEMDDRMSHLPLHQQFDLAVEIDIRTGAIVALGACYKGSRDEHTIIRTISGAFRVTEKRAEIMALCEDQA